MNRLLLICCLAVAVLSAAGAQSLQHLTIEQVFKNAEPKLTKPLPSVSGWADGRHYIKTRPKPVTVDAVTGDEAPYRSLDRFTSIVDSTIDLSSPVSHSKSYDRLLFQNNIGLYLLDTLHGTFKQLVHPRDDVKNPVLSPDGKYLAFTRQNDLYIIDCESGAEHRITSDGNRDVYSGYAAWLYYEEIFGRPSQYRAFWWSPDSRHLAFYRFDETDVPLFPIYVSTGIHGYLENTHYPEAGDANPKVRIATVSMPPGSPAVWADFDESKDQYFGTPFWTPDGKSLFVQWMNRRQDTLILYALNPASGTRKQIYIEHQTSWVEWFESMEFLPQGSGFILRSDKDGWYHLYRFGMDGKLKNRITKGPWAVSDLLQVDPEGRTLWFTAKKEASTNTDLYRVNIDGSDLKRLTFGDYNHTVQLSPDGSYFITSYSNVSTPPKMSLCDKNGSIIRELGDSRTVEFDKYELGTTELFRVKTADGFDLPVSWTLPVGFDRTVKYPVLISIYGGPGNPTVWNSWGGLRPQWLAREGMLQISIDHRGSGHFGKTGEALMYGHLGKWEMHDYIEVVKWLKTKPFVDSTRIAITGGSYGGYVTCMALTNGADYFTHGLALFSVTDFRLYDSHYTERYMNTPANNPEGYAEASTMTWADRYKGYLMIVHGTADDNVHMQNSIQLIDTLENLNKHFGFMLYPGGRHGWGGPKAAQLRNETYRFYYENLLRKPFPAEFEKLR